MRPSRSLRRPRRRAPSLSRPPAFTLAASLFRSLSISFRLSFLAYLLSFSLPPPPRPSPLARSFARGCILSVSSRARRSSLLSSPFRIGTSSALLASLFLFRGLSFRRRYITTLSRLARSSSNPPPARCLARRVHLRILLALALYPPQRFISLPVSEPLSIFPSFSLPRSVSFFRAIFFARPGVFLLRPMLFPSTFMYRLVSGM